MPGFMPGIHVFFRWQFAVITDGVAGCTLKRLI
jgi:hypothetical protein